jgi:hypothetical protein
MAQHMSMDLDPQVLSKPSAFDHLRGARGRLAEPRAQTRTRTLTSQSRADVGARPEAVICGGSKWPSNPRPCMCVGPRRNPGHASADWSGHTSAARRPWRKARRIMSVSRWPWRLVPAVEINLVLVTAVAFYFQSRQNRFAFGIDLLLKMDDRFNMMRASRQKASTYLKEKQGIRTCHRGPSSGISRACVTKPKGSSSCTR